MRLNPNKQEALKHIEALSGDPNSRETFQVVYSNKDATEEELRQLGLGQYSNGQIKAGTFRTGTLEQWFDWLVQYNNLGCGIYIMVNKGDGKGRKAANVQAVRALFAEDDTGQQLDYSPLQPNLVIQSKKGDHAYWLLDNNQKVENFSIAQQTLISHHGCDIKCKDICRVLRLSGFFHVGDPANPFQIKIKHLDTLRKHTMAEIVDAYPAKQLIKTYEPSQEDLQQYQNALAGTTPEDRAAQALVYIQKYQPLVSGFGERANRTLTLAARVYFEYGILDENKTYDLLKRWNANSPDGWTEHELRGFIRNASNFTGHAVGKALQHNQASVSPEAAEWLETAFSSINKGSK